jgi:hypothetical protein
VRLPLHPFLEMYQNVAMFKFHFLPWPGSLLDQDPEVLDAFQYIEMERGLADEEERKANESKNNSRRR